MKFSRALPSWFTLGVSILAGCQRTPQLERVVEAQSARDFAAWQRDNRDAFRSDEWAEFELVQQDIKVKIIAFKAATGADAVNDALRVKIHGLTVRQVFQQGYEARVWRLGVERTELEKMVKGNATLRTNPGDTASSDYLERKRQQQEDRLKKVGEEIRAVEKKLQALLGPAVGR